MKTNPEFQAFLPPLSSEELKQLETNLLLDGCRDPLVTWNDTLLDGHNRYQICQRHKLPFKVVSIELPDHDAALAWIARTHIGKRNFTPDAAKYVLGRRYNREKKARGGDRKSKAQNGLLIQTAEKIAKENGVGRNTVKRAGKFAEEIERNAELRKAIWERKPIIQIKRQLKELQREKRRKENRKQIAASKSTERNGELTARVSTIIIDPPWDWKDEGDQDQLGRARPDYATLSFKALAKWPVAKLADLDCHIYLWITNRSLPKGFALLKKWGFRYVTLLTWPKPSFGMGNYFRGQTEHVLFGIKGSQLLRRKNASTLLPIWKRGPGGHSSKPLEFYEFVESCSPGPYHEIFSRCKHPRKDWTYSGVKTPSA